MSNSNLSKTFALGSLESLKFRSSVLSLQRSFSLKFILGQKKFWVKKKFGSEKILVPRKILGIKNFGSENFLGPTNFLYWKNIGSQRNVWSIVTWVIRTPNPINTAKSPWVVYVSNFSLPVHPFLINFGVGSCSSCCSCSCDRGKTKSTPSLKT